MNILLKLMITGMIAKSIIIKNSFSSLSNGMSSLSNGMSFKILNNLLNKYIYQIMNI